ncbi:MAG: aldo/keto reductase [Bacteroidales bacterium]|nr:aldo/keto reductase [Bacteroidales bacterium]
MNNTSLENFPGFSKTAIGLWRLNSWDFSSVQLLDFIKQCMETGISTFDHADIYGNYSCEGLFGQAMKGQSALRSNMQLVSKCGIKLVSDKRPAHSIKTYDTSRAHIIQSVENSLQALQTDFLDVLLIHRPDPMMNADETAEAFVQLRDEGKVLFFGVSNFLPSQFDLLQSRLDFPLVTNQVEISVMCLDSFYNGILDQCQQQRVVPMAWSPLAGGRLFSSYDPQAERLHKVLTEIGNSFGGYSIDQVALAWLFKHPSGILPVLGSGNIERIRKAVEAEKINLSQEQWFSILVASSGVEIP